MIPNFRASAARTASAALRFSRQSQQYGRMRGTSSKSACPPAHSWDVVTKSNSIPPITSDPPKRVVQIDVEEEGGNTKADTIDVWYTEHGNRNGTLVVAIHGSPGSTFDWRYLGSEIEGGANFIRLDCPGHADSDRLPGQAGFERPDTKRMAEVCWAAVDQIALSSGYTGPVYLLAHSLGAELAVHMAISRMGLTVRTAQTADASVAPSTDAITASSSNSSTATASGHPKIGGLALVAPVGLRPHAAVRPSWLIHNFARMTYVPYLHVPVRNYLWALYVHALGLGNKKRLTTLEVEWCQRRILERSYSRYPAEISALTAAKVPTAMFFSQDDDAVDIDIARELAVAFGLDRSLSGGAAVQPGGAHAGRDHTPQPFHSQQPLRFALEFKHGGHMLQKNQAGIIGEKLRAWLAACEAAQS